MSKLRKGSHTVSRLTVHLVWSTKYRYKVLKGTVKTRCRELLIQDSDSMDIKILSGVVSADHVHMHIEYAPKRSISVIVKQLKGRSSSILQKEYPHLRKRYWGQRFWGKGFGAWSTGNITDKMVQKYLEHHRRPNDSSDDKFMLD